MCSSRIDDLASCFVATEALIEYADDADSLASDGDIALIALFDNEEVGSDSAAGAGSPIMSEAVRRVTTALGGASEESDDDLTGAALRRSFVLSVDMAHAVHPNYASKHEATHSPLMNKGVVIKTNSNQRYASNGVTSFVVRELRHDTERQRVADVIGDAFEYDAWFKKDGEPFDSSLSSWGLLADQD